MNKVFNLLRVSQAQSDYRISVDGPIARLLSQPQSQAI